VFSQVQGSQVVISLGLLRLRLDHLSERRSRLLQISALKKRDAESEFVASKNVGEQLAFERECSFQTLCWGARNHLHVLRQPLRIEWPLIPFHDLPAGIDQKRCRKSQVSPPVKKISVGNVKNARELLGRLKNRKRELFPTGCCGQSVRIR